MAPSFSSFASSVQTETALDVLAVVKRLKAGGKDVIELEIGDSPFDSTANAKTSGTAAIQNNVSHYCPSPGVPEFRTAAANFVKNEFNATVAIPPVTHGFVRTFFRRFRRTTPERMQAVLVDIADSNQILPSRQRSIERKLRIVLPRMPFDNDSEVPE